MVPCVASRTGDVLTQSSVLLQLSGLGGGGNGGPEIAARREKTKGEILEGGRDEMGSIG